jgi:hypothetical protein
MTYVKDTAPASWTKDGVYLWHRVEAQSSNLPVVGWAEAACGHRISEPVEFIDREMSFADWDREYGDDVDLCQCAVSAPKDVAKVLSFMKEPAEDE